MKNRSIKTVIHSALLALGMAGGSAHAMDYSIYGQAGLFGIGGGVGIAFDDRWAARVGYGQLDYSFDDVEVEDDETGSELTYEAEVDWGAGTALIDFYPFKGSFHLTGGVAFSGNGINLTGKPTSGVFSINGTDYTAAEIGSLSGEADWGGVAPYLGIGWGRTVSKEGHWSFNFDIGVILTGEPEVSLSANCNADPATCAQLSDDLAAEEKSTEEELSDVDLMPVINFAIGYRF